MVILLKKEFLLEAYQLKIQLQNMTLELLVCPVTKGPLIFSKNKDELISRSARLAYPIRSGIPVLIESEARTLKDEEIDR